MHSNSATTLYPTPFPVVHSILSPSVLLSEILPLYDLGHQPRCILHVRGVNDTYLIQTADTKYILRAYRAGWRTLTDILYEIDVLLYLHQTNIPVSIPIAQHDGQYICTIHAPEGTRHLVLFTYAPGNTPDRHDATDTYQHGKVIANLHNATDNFSSPHQRAPLDLTYFIDQSLATIQPLLPYSSADWDYLVDLSHRLHSHIQHLAHQGLNWGFCYGDGHMLNVHVDHNQVHTLFDFDCCAPGWRAVDLAVLQWCEGFYDMDPNDSLWHSFLKGYTELRPLTDVDKASVPAFVALREIWHTSLVASLQPISGIQGFDRILQRTVRLLQKWETTRIQW